MSNYNVGSLFAGVGGICQAFKDISCNVLWANENDKNSCKTYKLNHLNTKLIETDVKELTANDVESVDILTAGFPCQPFSQAGHGRGFDDDRGKLFFDFVRLLKDLQPKAYLLENVKTLVTHNDGKSFETVKDEVINAGYSFIPFVLKAHEYTEIPQGRERIYIVGFRNESEYFYNKPVKVNSQMDFGNAPCSASFKIPSASEIKRKSIRDFLEHSTVLPVDYYNKPDSTIHQTVRNDVIDENKVYQFRRWYVRENKSNVCPTLTANMGSGGHNIPIILDGETPRRLTPKECFNLQGFPENFKLPDDVPRGQLYKQSGNTVVIPMISRIAKEIVRVLDENPNC
jgi:DNA (cytosine-5)-methyltransferase 1